MDITANLDTSFLSLVTTNSQLDDTEILGDYGNEIFHRYSKLKTETTSILQNVNNEKLAITINLNLKVVKDIKKTDMTFSIAKNAEEAVYFIDNIKDINTTYPYSQKKARKIIQSKLAKQK